MRNRKPSYEAKLQLAGFIAIAGVDEVGRGALAGPLTVAAVILAPDCNIEGLTDSKLLTAKRRLELSQQIYQQAISISIVSIEPAEIDEIGIARADIGAMRRALARLATPPDFVITDGFAVDGIDRPNLAMKKGDQLCKSVSAASIVAKVHRDAVMTEYATEYPQYGFDVNKGYGTSQHLAALRQYGNSPLHRKTFIWNKAEKLEAS